KVRSTPSPTTSKPESIIHFSNKVTNLVAMVKTLNQQNHMHNPSLIEELVLKLPQQRQEKWYKQARKLTNGPSLEDFEIWLGDLAVTISYVPSTQTSQEKSTDFKKHERKPVMNIVDKDDKVACVNCRKTDHSLEKCKEFLEMTAHDKWKTVKNFGCCFRCLGKGHRIENCSQKDTCGIDSCIKAHHKLLHPTRKS
ncbi:unnamed protein product, partial [Allacma fusca]